jgi:C_GCAxxG_C_C family probable redox protein
MKKTQIARRKFIAGAGGMALAVATGGCNERGDKDASSIAIAEKPKPLAENMTEEQVVKLLDMKVVEYMKRTGNCAQSTYMALSELFGLEGQVDVKALTVMPGIAERGETCGTVVASLMVLGLIFGGERTGDRTAYEKALEPANLFYDRFSEAVGSTKCGSILEHKFGRKLDLRNGDDLANYQRNEGPAYCTGVVQQSARIAAKIIMENTNKG